MNKVQRLSNTSLSLYLRLYEDLVLDIAEQVAIAAAQELASLAVDNPPEWVGRHSDWLNKLRADRVSADIRLIRTRVAKEGFSFFTKTLPALGKRFDAALSETQPFDPVGFRKDTDDTRPRFLGWLWSRVLDRQGVVIPHAEAADVLRLRQLTYAYYKIEMGFTDAELANASSRYLETEQEIGVYQLDLRNPALDYSSDLIARVCSSVNAVDIIPRHGPGAVATGEKPWEKNRVSRFYPQLEKYYPIGEYFFSCAAALCDEYHTLESLEVVTEPTAKVVFVPKDSRGPRTISCEPVELQWIQQGLARNLIKEVERHRYTRGHVNFRDQTVNRQLALYGSLGANWVTLDMKDASDRVSLNLVKWLFRKTHLLDYMLACRSTCNLLPDGSRVTLNKFAPMGSALCFPVEALVFWSLITGLLYHNAGGVSHPSLDTKSCPTAYALKRALASVYVYGDDIVIHREDYSVVVQHLEAVGLKVNRDKCCVSGSFRESCGMDAFKGQSVTPIKFRTQAPSSSVSTQAVLSWVEYSNALDLAGYARATARVRSLPVLKTLRLPTLEHSCSAVSFVHFRSHVSKWMAAGFKTRFNKHLQRREIFAKVAISVPIFRRRSPWERSKRVLIRAANNLNNTYNDSELQKWRFTQRPQVLSIGNDSVWSADQIDHSLPEARIDVNRYSVRDRITLKSRWCALD